MMNDRSFWDSSAIVSVCVPPQGVDSIYQRLREETQLVVWWGTPVEVASAFHRLRHGNVLAEEALSRAQARLSSIRRGWVEISPSERVRMLAEALPRMYRLRAADFLQLAAALVWCDERPRNRPFVCLDRRLMEAARAAGFTALPEPLPPRRNVIGSSHG